MPQTSRAQRRRQPVRSAQSQARQAQSSSQAPAQRRVVRPALEPVDYSREYASVRRDLLRILIWTVVLFIGMGVVYFVI